MINFDDKQGKETHWVSLFIDRNTALYFHTIRIEYISQEVLRKIKDKSSTQNIFRTQDNDSIMCGFYCIAFTERMTRMTIKRMTIKRMTIKRMTRYYISTLKIYEKL